MCEVFGTFNVTLDHVTRNTGQLSWTRHPSEVRKGQPRIGQRIPYLPAWHQDFAPKLVRSLSLPLQMRNTIGSSTLRAWCRVVWHHAVSVGLGPLLRDYERERSLERHSTASLNLVWA